MAVHRSSTAWHIGKSKGTQYNDAWSAVIFLFIAVGYAFRIPALKLTGLLLLALVLLGWAWYRLSLWRLRYDRHFAEKRAFVGEEIELTLTVENHKWLPVSWLRLQDDFPAALPIKGGKTQASSKPNTVILNTVFALLWFERVERRYLVPCRQRGYFPFGPATLAAGDPFGLFSQQKRENSTTWFIIYPKIYTLTALGLPVKNPFGVVKSDIPLFPDPIRTVGVRDYCPGDALRFIHWKATAQQQRLQTKVLEPTLSHQLVIFLNVATMAHYWHGVIPRQLERVVSVAASVADYAAGQRWPVGLMANGSLPRSDQPLKVLPGRAPGQLTLIMEMLAAVTPVASMDIDQLLLRESRQIAWGATLVVVTAYLSEALLQTMRTLHDAGRRLTLIALTEAAPAEGALPGITVYHLPDAADADFQDISDQAVSLEALQRGLQVPWEAR